MPVLVAAVVLVGVLGVANLLFSFGVIRRLREHTEALNRLGAAPQVIAQAGAAVSSVEATASDGTDLQEEWRRASTLVAFFSPTCAPCREQLPVFVARAGDYHARETVLAVVIGGADEVAGLIDDLDSVARVVREDAHGPIQQAFSLSGYPAFAIVKAGGKIVASGSEIDKILPELQPA